MYASVRDPGSYSYTDEDLSCRICYPNLIKKKKYCRIYKITEITLGSTRNQNGYNKNCQKVN